MNNNTNIIEELFYLHCDCCHHKISEDDEDRTEAIHSEDGFTILCPSCFKKVFNIKE